MEKYRTKIIITVIIVIALTAAWLQGESYAGIGNGTADISAVSAQGNILVLQTAQISEIIAASIAYINVKATSRDTTESEDIDIISDERNILLVSESKTEIEAESKTVISQDTAITAAIAADGSFTVTLSVRADTILNNMHLLRREKHELVPADGVIFPITIVRAYEGESVFDVLWREMRNAGIHMSFRNTPILNSAYITAINNLYEFDVGNLSGWMYKVNGVFPGFGASQYILSPGDVIEWVYTCDLGRDVGGHLLSGGQRGD